MVTDFVEIFLEINTLNLSVKIDLKYSILSLSEATKFSNLIILVKKSSYLSIVYKITVFKTTWLDLFDKVSVTFPVLFRAHQAGLNQVNFSPETRAQLSVWLFQPPGPVFVPADTHKVSLVDSVFYNQTVGMEVTSNCF